MIYRRRKPLLLSGERDARAGRGQAPGVLVWLGWGTVILAVGALAVFWGLVGGAYLGWVLVPRLLGTWPTSYGMLPGALAGLVVAGWFGWAGRRWVLRWRRWRLRDTGVRATASVTRIDRQVQYGARGGNSVLYVVTLRWDDPGGGLPYLLELRYRFLLRKVSRRFEALREGRRVEVGYPPGRPWRLVADLPFVPVMADLLT